MCHRIPPKFSLKNIFQAKFCKNLPFFLKNMVDLLVIGIFLEISFRQIFISRKTPAYLFVAPKARLFCNLSSKFYFQWVQGWKLEKLDISGSQLAKEVNIGRNTIKRSKEARKVFKSLKMLNGKELAVGFELDNSTNNDSTNALPKKYGQIMRT